MRKFRGSGEAELLAESVAVLQAGGVIIAPTDTLYGLLADAANAGAVANIFAMKERAEQAPLPLICADLAQAEQWVRFDAAARKLAEHFWPGPLTLVLPATTQAPAHLPAADGSIALRVPAHDFCRDLARGLGRPLTATSANISGQPAAQQVSDIDESLIRSATLVFDGGACRKQQPSTIVKIESGRGRILRHGAIGEQGIITKTGEKFFGR